LARAGALALGETFKAQGFIIGDPQGITDLHHGRQPVAQMSVRLIEDEKRGTELHHGFTRASTRSGEQSKDLLHVSDHPVQVKERHQNTDQPIR
jgi:hypothetical protein